MSHIIVAVVALVVGGIGGILLAKPAKAEFDLLHERLSEFEAKVSSALAALKK